jgi:hypothetical protein
MQEGELLPTYGSPMENNDLLKEVILLAACGASEVLPQTPDLPADVFTACLTTPIKVAMPCCVLHAPAFLNGQWLLQTYHVKALVLTVLSANQQNNFLAVSNNLYPLSVQRMLMFLW